VTGRTAERNRTQIREALGFRVFSRGDEDKMVAWLAEQVCPSELNEDRQREAVLARCRGEKLEPPGRMERMTSTVISRYRRPRWTTWPGSSAWPRARPGGSR
jgi:hypothetical protein